MTRGRSTEPPGASGWQSDAALVKGCLRGEEEAWSALIDKYKNLIYSVPVKFGLSQDEAGEIFQAVCFHLFSELERLRDPQALPAWLTRVAYHECLRQKREAERFTAGDDPNTAPADLPDEGDLEGWIRQAEQEQKLREGLARLSPRCQELIRMLFFESPPRPYRKVAESLGLSEGSVAFLRSRCLSRLRRWLEKAEFVPE